MMEWQNDRELFELISASLYTAVVGDILDTLGRYHQFLPAAVRPLRENMRLVGRAMPVRIATVEGVQQRPFGKMTNALDQLQAGEIYLATGGAMNCAAWGEIMTAAAKKRGAAGAVLDGYHRDTLKVVEQNWPAFSRGAYAQDAGVRSIVEDYRCTVEIGRVVLRPGDLVIGDVDGVLIVPQDLESEVIALALEKARGEKLVRTEIEAGLSSTAAFEKHGIL